MAAEDYRIMGLSGSQVDVIGNSLVTYEPDITEAFAWTTATANIAGGACALLVTNRSSSKDLYIARAYIFSDKAGAVLFTLPTYGAFTGTAVTGIPLNRSAISIAPATAYANETVNTSENVFARISTTELDTGQYGEWLELDGKVQLGYRDSIGIDIVVDSGAFYSMIIGYYK